MELRGTGESKYESEDKEEGRKLRREGGEQGRQIEGLNELGFMQENSLSKMKEKDHQFQM